MRLVDLNYKCDFLAKITTFNVIGLLNCPYQIGKRINGIKPITIEEIVVFLLFNKSFFLLKVIGNKNFFFSKIVGNKSLFFPKVIGNFQLWLESFRDTRLEYDNVTICSK